LTIQSIPAIQKPDLPIDRKAVFDPRDSDPFYTEVVRGLRAKVERRIDSAGLRTLGVTSAVAGEGKTKTAIQLAVNMASTGRKKVLLMDLDLRKSDLAKEMRIGVAPGLGEYLSGAASREEIVRTTSIRGLHLVPAGKPVHSPVDLLAGEKFRSFLKELRGHFDLLLLDTPPILPVPDAVTISEQLDAFILVFRLSFTPYKLLQQAVDELGAGKILGVVLNGDEKKSDKYYSRYYGSYYKSPAVDRKTS
jgi:capsular exopolysaccharide synthesis family protein